MSTAQIIEGNWNQIVGHVRKRWGLLTDDDIASAEGNYELLLGKIQERTGKAREEIEAHMEQIAGHEAGIADNIREVAEEYAARAAEATAYATESVRDSLEECRERIKANPASSVAVLFGVGVVAGLFLGMMSRR